ncbi:MAG: c-type cytochrome [Candidatus Loosdrechtia sp.]|uniref:c-type cytochrome n=1 Tax=Candidatus Loosdrechtia sp. TaxID=3101272 RepID=UPI003A6873AE|nr:MAG: cytochrome c [Candidatus Jettenia sp. AMX2]
MGKNKFLKLVAQSYTISIVMQKVASVSAIVFFTVMSFYLYLVVYGQEKPVDAANLYKYYCATCHGADGKGTKRGQALGVPDFSDIQWQTKKTDEEILHSMVHGKNKMPRWEDTLRPEEIQALARYVRRFARKNFSDDRISRKGEQVK